MKIEKQMTDEAVRRELGGRLEAARLERNLTQAQLAERAGVSKRTIERLEGGEVAAQLSAFLRVCRALDLLDRLDALVPEAAEGPITRMKRRGRLRMRATGRKAKAARKRNWTWGDNP